MRDFLEPSRIVIGCDDTAVAVRVSDLYRDVPAPLVVTDAASAEMIKYASNVFLATKISYINSMAVICEAVNADIKDVALGMGYDPRIGFDFLHPGPGYGGSCFPKDTAALLEHGRGGGLRLQPPARGDRGQRAPAGACGREGARGARRRPAGATVAVWGLTFKANTDDLRDSPALDDRPPAAPRRAPWCARTTRSAARSARQLAPELTIADDPYAACAEPTCSPCSPSGTSSAGSTSGPSPTRWPMPRIVDARNLLDPVELRRSASTTRASGADGPRRSSTGGAGFVGSHLCRALLDRGDDVVAVDNFVTGRRENVADLVADARFALVEHDVVEPFPTTGPRRRAAAPFDAVLHFASPASPPEYLAHPILTLETGSVGHEARRSTSRGATARASCSRRRARCTATRPSTRSPRPIGAT